MSVRSDVTRLPRSRSGAVARRGQLAASGHPEQHLVVRLGVGAAIPLAHWFALTDTSTELPTRPPRSSGRHLTGLWLIPECGTSIV
jgi:hypothetical protein